MARALIASWPPLALTVTLTLPSVLVNLTKSSPDLVFERAVLGSSATPEMVPPASRVTATVNGVPSRGRVAVIPPVSAIGAFVVAATPAGATASRNAATARPLRRKGVRIAWLVIGSVSSLLTSPGDWHCVVTRLGSLYV